ATIGRRSAATKNRSSYGGPWVACDRGTKQCRSDFSSSGAERDRTVDLLNAIQALSQLSYSPVTRKFRAVPPSRQWDLHVPHLPPRAIMSENGVIASCSSTRKGRHGNRRPRKRVGDRQSREPWRRSQLRSRIVRPGVDQVG